MTNFFKVKSAIIFLSCVANMLTHFVNTQTQKSQLAENILRLIFGKFYINHKEQV